MAIIRRLIFKEWYRFFFGALFILFLLLTTANLISGFLRGNVTGLEVIQNYIIEVPTFIGKILPLSCLIGSLFAINKLINRNELTAILAGGYSRRKIIFDLIQISLFVGVLQFVNMGFVKPYFKSKRGAIIGENAYKFRNLGKKGIGTSSIGSGRIWYRSKKYYFSFVAFDKSKNILRDINLYRLDENYILKERISAKTATHQKDQTWLLEDVRTLGTLSTKEDFPQVSSHKTLEMQLSETPEEFKKVEADISNLSAKGLWNYILTLRQSGINTYEYEVIFYEIISSSIICVLFALIGSLSIFNPNRRASSFGKNVSFIFVFSIFYWLFYSYSLELGRSSKIDPILATFLIPILCLIFLSFIFYKNRKLA